VTVAAISWSQEGATGSDSWFMLIWVSWPAPFLLVAAWIIDGFFKQRV
jgi:hypothetical protein